MLGINNSNHIIQDEMRGGIIQIRIFYGIEVKCILLDLKVLQEANLYTFGENVGSTLWNSTDYWAYIARKYFPDFDFYWQIDYGCFLNALNY
ncbi:hypothetical protein [Helicobacter sp.]|uniref:hypothetical protein n=1 Tax=Helicobacter sp. TaxID=218 RepID=UPI0025B8710C|nr:hypothetical protein [Helicobacter sp.]